MLIYRYKCHSSLLKPRTPLEQEIASVLQNSSQMLEREDKELSLEEEKALKNMSLEEVCVLAQLVLNCRKIHLPFLMCFFLFKQGFGKTS